ncbi:MAG: hypothetical protein ACPGYT_05020 [Nitrospirales bacterium]
MSPISWSRQMALHLGVIFVVLWLIPGIAISATQVIKEQLEPSSNPQNLHVQPQSSVTPDVSTQKTCLGNIPCYKSRLERIIHEKGVEEALRFIEVIVTTDRVALREAHNLTHHVGRMAFRHLKDVTQVMSECTAAHQSGCYHGALEAYFQNKSDIQPIDVMAICSSKLEQEKGRFAYFNCFHGLGHGLTMHLNHDMKKSLAMCDTLKTKWDQESCYGGVFMETVVTGIRGFQSHSGHHGHHGEKMSDHPAKLIDPKNPLYPCSDLDKKYLRECYMMQTSIILHLTHYDFAKAFLECDKAPEDMRPTCYQSMGRDISGHTLRDIKQSLRLCDLGTATHQGRCFIGVVKNFLNVSGQASENAFEFCRQSPKQHKKDCHYAIGEELLTLYAKPQRRSRECHRSETKHIQDCRQGARLPLKHS